MKKEYEIVIIKSDDWTGESVVGSLMGLSFNLFTLPQLTDCLDAICTMFGGADYVDIHRAGKPIASYDVATGKIKRDGQPKEKQLTKEQFKALLNLFYSDARFTVQVDSDALQTSYYFTCKKGSAKRTLTKYYFDNTYYIG